MPVVINAQTSAKAMGKNLPISPKVSIEICNYLRGREIEDAIKTLERVQQKKQAIPYKRFTNGPGHKPGKGMAAGRYPIKAAGEFLQLLNNVKRNAANQGLSGSLKITHIAANRANEPARARAKERVTFKRTHVEVIAQEAEKKEKTAERKKMHETKNDTAHETKKD